MKLTNLNELTEDGTIKWYWLAHKLMASSDLIDFEYDPKTKILKIDYLDMDQQWTVENPEGLEDTLKAVGELK